MHVVLCHNTSIVPVVYIHAPLRSDDVVADVQHIANEVHVLVFLSFFEMHVVEQSGSEYFVANPAMRETLVSEPFQWALEHSVFGHEDVFVGSSFAFCYGIFEYIYIGLFAQYLHQWL